MRRADMKFDVRTQRHRLRRGEYSHDELDKHLDDLPDDAAEAVQSQVSFSRAAEERYVRQEADGGSSDQG